jgi:hypothetical protein
MIDKLEKAALVTLVDCLGLKRGEKAVVITDPLTYDVALALFNAAAKTGADPLLALMPARKVSGEEPPEAVAELMKVGPRPREVSGPHPCPVLRPR